MNNIEVGMEMREVRDVPDLHETPLPKIFIEPGVVVVEADDTSEKRIRITFRPCQAVRIITEDCFIVPYEVDLPGQVTEILDSPWVQQLKENLQKKDEGASFMNKGRHFLIPAMGGVYVEVVAWDVKWERIEA